MATKHARRGVGPPAASAFALFGAYFATGEQSALEIATSALNAISDVPTDSPELAQQLNSLGADLRAHFKETGDPAVLEAALVAYEKSLKVVQPTCDSLSSFLSSLALGLIDRFDFTGRQQDIDRAVDVSDEAVTRASPEDKWLILYRINLAKALITRQETRTDNDDDLERAAALVATLSGEIRSVCEAHPSECDNQFSGALADVQGLIGQSFLRRFERSDRQSNLDAGIDNLRSAAANINVPLLTAAYGADLSHGLIRRFRLHGRLNDLEDSIEISQNALDQIKGEEQVPPELVANLKANLGMALRARYEVDPDLDILQRVVHVFRETLALTPKGTPGRFRYLTNLANSLADLQNRVAAPLALEEVIDLYEQALAEEGVPDSERDDVVLNLGGAQLDRFVRDHQPRGS